MKHSPEPWWLDGDGFVASGHGTSCVNVADPRCDDLDIDVLDANAERIVACVNACAGLTDQQLEDLPAFVRTAGWLKA